MDQFHTCAKCGLKIRSGVHEMDHRYHSAWQTPLENLNLTGGTTARLANNYSTELIRDLGVKNLNGYRILDFGGGRGEMALSLQKFGAKVVVVDPYSCKQLKEKGLTAVPTLTDLAGGETFNGVIAIDVIEHLLTPWDELYLIRQLLGSQGFLYLSTPNGSSLNASINGSKWREALNPSHLLLFTPKSIELALKKAGFTNFQRLSWRVDYSENMLIQSKDWLLRMLKVDGVLRYLAYK